VTGRLQRVLTAIAVIGAALFIALTIAVTSSHSLAIDTRAFSAARDLRTPWLTHAARIITVFGVIAIVGPALLIGGALLTRSGRRMHAAALVSGGALTWLLVWIIKAAVDRPRPPAPLINTTGQSFPSGHAANSVGWLALGIAVAVLIPTRGGRVAAITIGAALTILIGLSRIYLRAHFASDVLAGEALAAAVYATAALVFGRRVIRIG
jgi:membrane-associated phospholipid phosphatase